MKKAIILLLLATSSSLFAEAVSIKPAGRGTQASPYLFDCLENFFWLRQQTEKMDPNVPVYCKQIQDIDASATQQGGDYAWSEINFSKNNLFVYDGQGNTIYDLEPEKNDALFGIGYMQLKNIRIKGAEGKKTCALTKDLRSGETKSGLLENCHIKGLLGASAALAMRVQGSDVKISDCHVEAEMEGNKQFGALIYNFSAGKNSVIKNTSFKGKIKNDSVSRVGGIIYMLESNIKFEDCYVDFEVEKTTGEKYAVAGLVYIASSLDNTNGFFINAERCYVTGKTHNIFSPSKAFFATVGDKVKISVKDSYYNKILNLSDAYATPKTDEEMKQQATYKNWDFEKVWEIEEEKSLPKLRTEREYPSVNIKYKGKGSCAKINDVLTIEGGSEKDSLIVRALPNTPCQVKKIVANAGLKKLRVDGDLEELLIEGPAGSILINGGDLGREGKDYAVIFNGDKTKVQVKVAKNKETKEFIGGNVRGNILCGTQNEEGEITSYGKIKKFNVLGGNLENGKLTTGKLEGLKIQPKNGRGGQTINFTIEEIQ